MATAQIIQDEYDDLLTCTICLETFNIPKYLPCLHTFCESCISTYIASSTGSETNENGFSCPVCRKIVPLQEFEGKSERWGEQLPTNHLITSMLDKRALNRSEKLCNICEANEKGVSWCCVCKEAFCTSCEYYHRKFKMSSSHKLIPLQDMVADIPSSLPEDIPCENHKNKLIEIYCADHAQPCCTVCATVSHRQCTNVVAIEDVISGIKESSKATRIELSKHLTQTSMVLSEAIIKVDTNASSIDNDGKTIMEEINTIQNDIVKHFTKIGQKLKDELAIKTKETVTRLKDKSTEMSSFKATVDNYKRILDSSTKHGSELQYMIDLNKLLSRKKELESEVKEITQVCTEEIRFKPNEKLKCFKENIKVIGEICMSNSNSESKTTPSVYMRSGKVKVLYVIDENKSSYRSGLFLKDNIVLTDYDNKRIIFYDSKGTLDFEIKLPQGPYDITIIEDMKLAVSSARIAKDIYIIDVLKREVERSIRSENYVGGLQYIYNSGEFITSFLGVLRWIDITSGKLKKETKTKGETYYLYANAAGDYICADGKEAVSCTVQDEKKFTYVSSELLWPRGIDVDFEGNIYICGYKSGNVHQITPEGSLVRIINSSDLGITKPWVIRFKKNSSQFLLTDCDSGNVAICEIY